MKKKAGQKRTGFNTSIIYAYEKMRDWMKPNPNQKLSVQIILFVVKLPVLIMAMALSPVFLLLMFITFVVAL